MTNQPSLEQQAAEFYKENMRGCYRPTTGEEPRISWLLATFAQKVKEDALLEVKAELEGLRELSKQLKSSRHKAQAYLAEHQEEK